MNTVLQVLEEKQTKALKKEAEEMINDSFRAFSNFLQKLKGKEEKAKVVWIVAERFKEFSEKKAYSLFDYIKYEEIILASGYVEKNLENRIENEADKIANMQIDRDNYKEKFENLEKDFKTLEKNHEENLKEKPKEEKRKYNNCTWHFSFWPDLENLGEEIEIEGFEIKAAENRPDFIKLLEKLKEGKIRVDKAKKGEDKSFLSFLKRKPKTGGFTTNKIK